MRAIHDSSLFEFIEFESSRKLAPSVIEKASSSNFTFFVLARIKLPMTLVLSKRYHFFSKFQMLHHYSNHVSRFNVAQIVEIYL